MITSLFEQVPGLRNVARWLGHSAPPPPTSSPRQFLLDMLPRDGIGAEIGVHQGDFSAQLLTAATPKELHLVDPWKHEQSELYKNAWYGGKADAGQAEMDARYAGTCERFAAEIASGQIQIHRGFSDAILGNFPDGYLDWIYIDGNHLYDYVKQDLELAFRKVRAGGYITGDDYGDGGWWEGGVKKAVDEFIEHMPVQVMAIESRQFVLRK